MSVNLSKCICDADHLCATHWTAIVKFSDDEAFRLYTPRVELNDYPAVTRDAGFNTPLIRR